MTDSITWKCEKCTTILLNFNVKKEIVQKPTKYMVDKRKIPVFIDIEKDLDKEIYKKCRKGFYNHCAKITKSEKNKHRY